MSKPIDKNKVVVITGSGISAPSGIPTFRDSDGLWNNYPIADVASLDGWNKNPALVLDFYNQRRIKLTQVLPNAAHYAIAKLEQKYEVVVVTQNVDDLHERAGSTNVIHLHGELNKARSTVDDTLIYSLNGKSIKLGDICDQGSQLRPHIVWFGEQVHHYNQACAAVKSAGKVLVVGTSLTVYPAASLLKKARYHAEKIFINLHFEENIKGFKLLKGNAIDLVPTIVSRWQVNL
ncbi:MAG: NAD-dependent deacylase [Deltaproteobacteria bacterium]|nr:NAD-dependent deacylase [Deltaproteobacteria bacterium]